MPPKPFRVLLVCTANLCRSPMAEIVFRSQLEEIWGSEFAAQWHIQSAGTHAANGHPMHPTAERVLTERGYALSGDFRSQALTEEMVQTADLVLTATLSHRASVAELHPGAIRRTFTLRQAARLVAAANSSDFPPVTEKTRGLQLVERISFGRTQVQPAAAEAENIADPIGQRLPVFRSCAEKIAASVAQLLQPSKP